MISFCTLARDTPDLEVLIKMFKMNCPCDYEICIGDNSTKLKYRRQYEDLADVYVRIEDKELFRMGLPWGHNRVAAMANSYKIFYLDSDEYPVWIDPNIEQIFDTTYIPMTLRYDFLTMDDIIGIDNSKDKLKEIKKIEGQLDNPPHHQDRLYNARYVKFNGVCHSVFHAPQHFRGRKPAVYILHNKTVRDAKNIDRMRDIIREQYSRMIINPELSSSKNVFQWAKEWKRKELPDRLHKFIDYKDFKRAYD